jgi:hypothetical protein
VVIEIAAGTAAWGSGASYPASDKDTDIVPILEITCADNVITSYIQRRFSDIRIVGGAVPDGTALGQFLHWDATAGAWVASVVGTLAADDMLKWDATNAKWVKVTPTTQTVVTDMQYDSTNHVVQKKTISLTIVAKGSESSWTTITGGTAVAES